MEENEYKNKLKKIKNRIRIARGLAISMFIIIVILVCILNKYNKVKENENIPYFIKEEVQSFNNKFNVYEGRENSGTTINMLVRMVIQNNMQKDYKNRFIIIEFNERKYEKEEINKLLDNNEIDKNKKYSVKIKYENEYGYVSELIIKCI